MSHKESPKETERPSKQGGHDSPVDLNPSWFERPANINRLIGALVLACLLLAVADFFYVNHHPHFDLEKSFGFQAWFGFVSFVVVVFLGRFLRLFIQREENYYDQ